VLNIEVFVRIVVVYIIGRVWVVIDYALSFLGVIAYKIPVSFPAPPDYIEPTLMPIW